MLLLRRLLVQLDEECPKPLDKYELLTQIAATNVTLLYYVLIRHLADLAPIVYTCELGLLQPLAQHALLLHPTLLRFH